MAPLVGVGGSLPAIDVGIPLSLADLLLGGVGNVAGSLGVAGVAVVVGGPIVGSVGVDGWLSEAVGWSMAAMWAWAWVLSGWKVGSCLLSGRLAVISWGSCPSSSVQCKVRGL